MSVKKSITTGLCALSFSIVTGMATAASPANKQIAQVEPTTTLTPAAVKQPGQIVSTATPTRTPSVPTLITTDDIEQTTRGLFARIPASVAPTGILIERDAPDSIEAVALLDGTATAPATTYAEYNFLVGEMATFKNIADIAAMARNDNRLVHAQSVVPVSVMLMNYDTFGDNSDGRLVLDGNQQFQLTTTVAEATDTKMMFAVSLQTDALSYLNDSFILPSANFISNVIKPSQVTSMSISFEGSTPRAIRFDQPFTISEKFVGAETVTATISLQTATQRLTAAAIRAYDEPTLEQVQSIFTAQKLNGPISKTQAQSRSNNEFAEANCEIRCYQLDTVEQQIEWSTPNGEDYEQGKIYPMAYPRSSTRISNSNSKLGRTVVFVDGFDIEGDRDHISLYKKSPAMYPMFHNAGYDVIMLDYEDGTNWIQPNALTLREFMVNHLPHYVDPEYLHETVIVGRSMGGLVVRYALRTAEIAGEDHHANLYFSLDTPHLGASAPAGVFHAFEWLADQWLPPVLPQTRGPIQAMRSPAAFQQLRKLPNDNDVLVAPDAHIEFMALMQELGVPHDTRNVALSNGSGTGSTQLGSERWTDINEWNPSYPIARANVPLGVFNYLFHGGLPIWRDRHVDIDSNHIGRVFSGEKKRRFLGIVLHTNRVEKFVGDEANYVDIAPGGNISDFAVKLLDGTDVLRAPSFVPTISGLMYGNPEDIFAIPADDENLLDKTPFDDVFFDSCNTEHATFTRNMSGVVQQELVANATGTVPPIIRRPTERCADIESTNQCFKPVEVYGEDGELRLIEVNLENEVCKIIPVPEGRTGFFDFHLNFDLPNGVAGNRSMLIDQLPQTACPAGSHMTDNGCNITSVPSSAYYSLLSGNELIIYANLDQVQSCPSNTTQVFKGNMTLRCKLNLAAGFDGSDVRKIGNDVYYTTEYVSVCPEGTKASTMSGGLHNGRKVCTLGHIPYGTWGVIRDGYFAYTEHL